MIRDSGWHSEPTFWSGLVSPDHLNPSIPAIGCTAVEIRSKTIEIVKIIRAHVVATPISPQKVAKNQNWKISIITWIVRRLSILDNSLLGSHKEFQLNLPKMSYSLKKAYAQIWIHLNETNTVWVASLTYMFSTIHNC